jgi:hypothetical protein
MPRRSLAVGGCFSLGDRLAWSGMLWPIDSLAQQGTEVSNELVATDS